MAEADQHDSEEGGCIVKLIQADYDLDDLVAGITPANLHSEVDFGLAIGKEAL